MSTVKAITPLVAIIAFCASANGQTRFYSDWQVGPIKNDGGFYASTTNDSGVVFGQACFIDIRGCQWMMINNNIGCEENHKYPALANSDSGAHGVQLLCSMIGPKLGYRFTDFDAIESLVVNSIEIGFATPMENGLFKVNRFSLNGSNRAIKAMRESFELILNRKPAGTRDTSI